MNTFSEKIADTYHKETIAATRLTALGLDPEHSEKLTRALNQLLADYSVFYQNVRGFHWNVTGAKFFELHKEFEALYNGLGEKIDEIAERVRILTGKPNHKFSHYLKITEIEESDATEAHQMVANTLESLQYLVKAQRQLLSYAGDANDEGTANLASDNISEHEKSIWMFAAYLEA